MSIAFECDRCGELHSGYSDASVIFLEESNKELTRIMFSGAVEEITIDSLCERCFEELEEFMENDE